MGEDPFKRFNQFKRFERPERLNRLNCLNGLIELLEWLKLLLRFNQLIDLIKGVIIYFEDLEVWKSARKLTNRIYQLTASGDFSKCYGLRDQIRRASVSIMSNIAEGYERGGNQELIQFLSIAKGSCGEVRCQLYVAGDQEYIPQEELQPIIEQCKRISIMTSNFMELLKGSRFKGAKYKMPRQKSVKEEMDGLMKELNIK